MTNTVKSGAARPVKKEGYCSVTLHAKRDQRRRDAVARNVVYAKLSLADKIERAHARPGYSRRELARLNALKKKGVK